MTSEWRTSLEIYITDISSLLRGSHWVHWGEHPYGVPTSNISLQCADNALMLNIASTVVMSDIGGQGEEDADDEML